MYGISITAGIIVAALFAELLAKRENKNTEILWGGVIVAVVCGMIGARLYHVLDLYEYYLTNPILVFEVWQGGMGIIGGILFGTVGIITYLKVKKEPVLEWLDLAGICMPIAQTIGRLGNHFNKELLPYAYYELVADLVLSCLLLLGWYFFRHRAKPGSFFFLYLIGYSLIRIILEGQRTNSWYINNTSIAILFSSLTIVLSLCSLGVIYLKGKNTPV